MKNNKTNKSCKIEPLRIIIFVISVVAIVLLWARKDIVSIYATMPREQIFPLVITTLAVSLLKVALIAAAVFVIKCIVDKVKSRRKK